MCDCKGCKDLWSAALVLLVLNGILGVAALAIYIVESIGGVR